MLVVLNGIIIIYLFAMFYFWGTVQGFFSALLHLVCVIAAGALALALWEPLTVGLLLTRMGAMGWAVGLVGPFVLLLIVLRVVLDLVCKGNVLVHRVTDIVGGGVCGVLAGILSAGITLIGIGFLATGENFMGYQALVIDSAGHVTPNPDRQLWVAVDQQAAGFFRLVSGGALNPGRPLSLYTPDFHGVPGLVSQAAGMALTRHYDPNSSVTATPDCVSVTRALEVPAPFASLAQELTSAIGDTAGSKDGALFVVDTQWNVSADGGSRAYDEDQRLRVPASQVSLIAWDAVDQSAARDGFAHYPLAAVVEDDNGALVFWPLAKKEAPAGTLPKQTIGYVFYLPQGQVPKFIQLRNIRVRLPEAKVADAAAIQAALGLAGVAIEAPAVPGSIKALRAEATSRLPYPIANPTPGLKIDAQGAVLEGNATADVLPQGQAGPGLADTLAVTGGRALVRVHVAPDQAQEFLSRARFSIRSAQGTDIPACAYVWVQAASGKEVLHVEPDSALATIAGLPLKDMHPGDQLYLYFQVPKGSKIVAACRGSEHRYDQKMDLNVP